MDIIRAIEQQQINPEVVDFNVGDNVKVHYRIKEGNRERIQVLCWCRAYFPGSLSQDREDRGNSSRRR